MATDALTELTYLEWQPSYTHTRPYRISEYVGRRRKGKNKAKQQQGDEGEGKNDKLPNTNLVFRTSEHAETIRDIRGSAEQFTLDTNGFAYIRCPPPALTRAWEYADPRKIESVFLPECEAILRREVEGADEVVVFDWKIRKRKSAKERRTRNPNLQGFAKQVHCDTLLTRDDIGTPIMQRIRNHLPEESHHLLSGRVQLINLWRPINAPVEDHPIAVCDGQSLDASKLLATDMIRGAYTGTMLYPLFEPDCSKYNWYYMSRQEPEDVLLFKGFDSAEGRVKYTPHTSFIPLDSPPSPCPRVSVEVRALVFAHPVSRA
ncbi:hypothetical protein BJX68DRAFT_13871 [Aspergillus pseudodeflectus]|uniref:Methyltransferase n=1 Tax=Aspergillus pseudodeflectus TaxID=176178 RepID=A0ABR4LC48_9EURO